MQNRNAVRIDAEARARIVQRVEHDHIHILALELATPEELELVRKYAYTVNDVLKEFFLERGLRLIDFKIEFGIADGQVLLADEISPDTCRLWDVETNEKMDKDRFRRDLGNVEETYLEVFRRVQE